MATSRLPTTQRSSSEVGDDVEDAARYQGVYSQPTSVPSPIVTQYDKHAFATTRSGGWALFPSAGTRATSRGSCY